MTHDDPADQLDRYLDRLVESPRRGIAPNGHSSELMRAVEAIHASYAADPSADPRFGFLARLEDQLEMDAPGILSHAPAFPFPTVGDRRRWSRRKGRPLGTVVRPLRYPAVGGLATAALLVLTLLGVYVSLLAPRGEGGPSVPAAAPGASPAAGPSVEQSCADPFVCAQLLRPLGHMYVQGQFLDLDDAALDVRQVQLQGWAVAPGATLTNAAEDSAVRGFVVDYVLSGAYVATFAVPVVVSPGGVTNDSVQYLDAGTPVELVRGDAVAYRLGGLTEIRNPLSAQRLEFKRAVVYEGDIGAFSATADGISSRVEGDATLPETIGSPDAFPYGPQLDLWFIEELPTPFPPARWDSSTIVGPVDPQRGPEGTEGFVLVISASGP